MLLSSGFPNQHLKCVCKRVDTWTPLGLWLRLTQQPCSDVPNVGFLQLIVLSIIGIDAHVVKGRDHAVEIEAHKDKSIDHLLVIATVPVDVNVSKCLRARCERRLTVRLSPQPPPPSTASASAPSSLLLPLHCPRRHPSSAPRHTSQPIHEPHARTPWDFA